MKRYADIDKLYNSVKDNVGAYWSEGEEVKEECLNEIYNAHNEDVEEVRHGEWTKSSPYNRFMNCSVCGFGQNHTAFNYCPNCGAKMDGDRREG